MCRQVITPSVVVVILAVGAMALSGTSNCLAEEPSSGIEEIKDITIVVGDQPYTGDLIPPATESGFRFRWKETGDVLTFRWSSLEQSERAKIQKLFRIEVAEGGTHLQWGEEVDCVRLKLASNRSIEGKMEPERALPGFYCIRNATQVVQVPQKDVLGTENIKKRESDIYPPEEALSLILLRTPPQPDSAADHLELARKCSVMGLYQQAMEYLDCAKEIDPQTEERTKDFRQELVVKHEEQQANKLYEEIVLAIHREEFGSAKEKCEKYLRNFPTAEGRTKVELLVPQIAEKSKVDLSKQIIFMYYNLMPNLIAERMGKKIKIDANGLPVSAIPGKQVTTKAGAIIRGRPQTGDDPESVYVQSNDLVIQIPRKEVLTIQDVDLSKGVKMVPPTYAELKEYVTDPDGGLGGDLAAHIGAALGLTPAQVREVWDGRFVQTAIVKDSVLEKTPIYTRTNKAFYDKGTWLRYAGTGGAAATKKTNVQRLPNRNRNNNNNNNNQQQQDEQERLKELFPEYSDDPEVWWKVQSNETKARILRAMAAEKIYRVKEIQGKVCPECAGTGVIVNANQQPTMCPVCRGLKTHAVVIYE